MRALLIQRGGVIEVALPDDPEHTLQGMYDLIGCQYVESGGVPAPGHAAWVDDEGLFVLEDGHPTITTQVAWTPQRLAGKILITGLDEEGNTTAAALTAQELHAMLIGQWAHNEGKPS